MLLESLNQGAGIVRLDIDQDKRARHVPPHPTHELGDHV